MYKRQKALCAIFSDSTTNSYIEKLDVTLKTMFNYFRSGSKLLKQIFGLENEPAITVDGPDKQTLAQW